MEKTQILKIISLILTIIMSHIIFSNTQNSLICNATSGVSEIVMERDSGRVLYESNADKTRSIASTTKIVTAITVIENSNLNDKVIIPREAVGVEGSSIYLKENEEWTIRELLYGLMLRSGNDSAVALAIKVGGSVDKFATLMNNVAIKANATNSHFSNPHGLTSNEHYSSAKDLAMIASYALKNQTFREVVSAKRFDYCHDDGVKRTFINKNKMLFNYDGADGVKTGYTLDAGRCLVSSATKNGMQLVCVVLNCGPMFERSSELLDLCFANYHKKQVINASEPIGQMKVESYFVSNVLLDYGVKSDFFYPLTQKEENSLKFMENIPEYISFPVKSNEILGELSVYLDNKLIYSEKLYIIDEKSKLTFEEAFYGICKSWSFYEN